MHPAPSIIFFTAASGLGFGLLFFLGLGFHAGPGAFVFAHFGLGFVLAVGGLCSSLFHLGHPERAWKALSQWRSSWLSREGIMAVLSCVLMGIYALGQIFGLYEASVIGLLGGLCSLITVYTTSMIYAQMKTVPRWNHWTTPVQFLFFAVGGGALLAGLVPVAVFVIAAAVVFQVQSWRWGDTRFADHGHTRSTATGLGQTGAVRAFEPPHTGTNYLMKEMVHTIGRKHARKLRVIGLALVAAPLLLMLFPAGLFGIGVLALAHLIGVLVVRWLFFAEAEHVVGLYYGAH